MASYHPRDNEPSWRSVDSETDDGGESSETGSAVGETPETGSAAGQSKDTGSAIGQRISPLDVAFVAVVPLVLIGVFLLPEAVKRSFTLSYLDPTVVTAYTAHFVHLDSTHLLTNLVVFLLVVPFVAAVSVRNGRRREFYLVAFTILAVFPFVFSALNVLFPRPRIGLGFSGINLAFVGYLPHVVVARFELERPDTREIGNVLLPVAFFVGTATVVLRLGPAVLSELPARRSEFAASGLFSVSAAVVLLSVVFTRFRERDWLLTDAISPLVGFGGLLFVLLLVIGFPQPTASGGSVLNVFVHFLGYSFGYLVPYTAFRVVGIDA
ncbi:MAG: hypothetical protein ABEI27_08635 [Halobellus sp.]|uniref:hypothetical protein n=1 Tax=Halobellus sp. TaxID=1979212 RepID=UPI0035D4EF93